MRVRTRTHKNNRTTDVRAVNAQIIGDKGPIPGVSFTFTTRRADDFLACQERAGQRDMKENRISLTRGKVGSA